MSIKTFTAELPKSLVAFGIKYSQKQKEHRNSAMDLITNDVSKTKQNQELQKFGYNKRQANSLLIDIEGKISSAQECRKAHIETLEGKISSAQEQVAKWSKQLEESIYPCCPLRRNEFKTLQHELRFKIHHKGRYILAQQRKIDSLIDAPLEVNFGSEFNFPLVGSQGESNGNQICQYDYKKKQLKIRVPVEWEAEFGGKYVYGDVEFAYGQECIEAALMRRSINRNNGNVIPAGKGESLTWRLFYKNNRWYIAVSVEVTEVPIQSKPIRYGCLGVDLNPGVIGWCYVDYNGNPVAYGQIKLSLHSRRSGQIEAELADAIKQLILITQLYGCAIVIENLSFAAKKKRMKEEGRRYARMLNFFAYSTFNDLIQKQCTNRGIQLIKVNPAYSSLIGLTKFMALYGMSSDTAAGLVIARRAMKLSEALPTHVALPVVMAGRRHVWASWYRLNKRLKSVRRHEYYNQQALTAHQAQLLYKERGEIPTWTTCGGRYIRHDSC
ncbi:MAG: IS200/IS605 family accessory protein TnpB-related protein [Nostocaceae cyanobacterium]|nr:IS200/IS605 family accessory protein TnpB-related protein [Nostocaceae cyanobacterium]